ncbi:MAG: hypothetical protein AAFV07_03105 [Bacteroidota bacterium]
MGCAPVSIFAHETQGLIYGEVHTVDGRIYRGVIRWGIEEAYWDDLFIAKKADHVAFAYLSGDQIHQLGKKERASEKVDWGFWSLWETAQPKHKPAFRCRFGEIAGIQVTGPQSATLTLKDGQHQKLIGASNDIGTWIYVTDQADVRTKILWERIDHIVFLPTPDSPVSQPVQPLYGTVFTTQGAFKGYIQWDREEELSSDLLEGKSQGRKRGVPFGEIQEIRQSGEGVDILLWNGEKFWLGESDDASPSNHGIIVKNLMLGSVLVTWEQFRFVRFSETPAQPAPSYADFAIPKVLFGRIELQDGEALQGRMIFDLDETYDFELIEGRQDGISYFIPLRNVKQIERRGPEFCAVLLHNGDKLFLGGEHDVSDRNWGLLLWDAADQQHVIDWTEINRIQFDRPSK